MRTALAVLVLSIAITAQQRDAPVVQVGTGAINGVVVSADARLPLRRAVVSISGDQLSASRSVITDDAGRFSFAKLPAGTYGITAKKASWLGTEFGSTKPGRPGSRVVLAAGQQRSITLAMFKGAAIGGTLRNPDGAPLAGVSVVATNVRLIGQRDPSAPEPATTNDRGEYRIFGLMPGEYVVVATPVTGGSGEIGARSASEMDAILAGLAARRARPNTTATSAAGPALPLPRSVAYSPIYFPGTPLFRDAEKIQLVPGDERDRLSFDVARVPVASIEGAISGDVSGLAGVQLAIVPETQDMRFAPGSTPMSITGVPPNDQGEFRYGNLPPGKFQIVARGRRASGEALYAVAEVEIHGQDVKDLALALQPGGTLSGKVVFDSSGGPPPTDLARIRIGVAMLGDNQYFMSGAMRIGNMLSDVPLVGVKSDGTFRIDGLGPARYTVTCTLPGDLAGVWKLRSAIVNGRDLLDAEFSGPRVQLRDVIVTLSDKRTEIAGSLLSDTGQPTADYYVIAFSADRADWRAGSRRNMSARPATNGRFVFSDLPAGEYYVAALTDLDPGEWQEAVFLEQVAPVAVRISLAEGEKKSQDLRIK